MRRWTVLAGACAVLAGCGDGGDQNRKGQKPGGGELTLTLAPTPSSEPAAPAPAPEAGFETIAAPEPVAITRPPVEQARPAPKEPEPDPPPAQIEVALAPAPDAAAPAGESAAAEAVAPIAQATPAAADARPAGAGAWAGYLRRAGFPCRRIAAAERIERAAGPGLQYYKVECEGGGSYQATNRRGHLYFRRWRG